MTATNALAQKIAEDFVRAWTGKDVEKALSLLADDVVCEAPSGIFEGVEGYRRFLEPFASTITRATVIDVLGNGTNAATVYTVDTPILKDFRGTDYLTVENGRITRVISVFDRLPMAQARGDIQP
ncbi:nuclear transport factor 2 family protein [Nonomuraea aurantiaca]|uniref:nuclear transport factor 2 family protein n=1 Tax=Nonomuraea aurantiaca TaxID=2878562 RepID=UPI001CDA30B8|nr:nuclear transport factor 2 family protein [Nonomuraea aurantiaca]MCA2226108.1 nuclear transport factor 2 family protein [Nonomuraea aurantiaca]